MLEPLYTCNLACLGCATSATPASSRTAVGRRLPAGGRRERRADGLDLRRRADHLPRAARADRRHHRAQAPHLPVHQRAAARREGVRRHPAAQAPDHQRPPRRPRGDARLRVRQGRRLRQGDRDDPRVEARAATTPPPTPRSSRRPTSTRSRSCAAARREIPVDGMLISPGYHYESVKNDIFLARKDIHTKFERVLEIAKQVPDHLDADVPRVRRRQARLHVLALDDRHAHAAGLEGPLLPDRQAATTRPGTSSGTGSTGTTGSRARTRAARTARCTRASRRRSCATCTRARRT